MSKKKKNEFLRSVKDRVETIQDMDKSKKIMAGGVIGIVALAAIIGVSMSGKSARSVATETTASVESSTTAAPVAAEMNFLHLVLKWKRRSRDLNFWKRVYSTHI